MESKLNIDDFGTKNWRLSDGKRHREDGPAVEYSNGRKYWYLNGKLYRERGYKYKMRSKKFKQLLKQNLKTPH